MERAEEKLQVFTGVVMKEATLRKKKILEKAEEKKHKILEKREIEFLEKAYQRIQETVRKVHFEQNKKVSRAVIDSKKSLLKKRTEIMKKIFDNVEKRLSEFRDSKDYIEFLKEKVLKALSEVGEEEVTIIIEGNDIDIIKSVLKEIKKDFNIVVSSDEDMMGGCIVQSKKTNLLVDYSIRNLLYEQKEEFLEISKMCII